MSALYAQRCSELPAVTADEVAAYVVDAAVWAPSVHNTQPWWFAVRGAEIALHADRQRQLRVADPAGREMMISCGAALFTAKLALRSLGYVPETRVLPEPADPSMVARLRWRHRAPTTEHESELFSQVLRRRSHRGGFGPAPLLPGLLGALQRDARQDGAALRVAADEGSRAAVAAVVEMAERAERLDSAYVRELAAWAPPPGSMRRDGVSPSAYLARPERTCPPFPARDFGHGHGWGLPASTAALGGQFVGIVCVLTTPADGPADWINAGHALQRVLLTCASCGVAAALSSQPVEVDWLREVLRAQLGDGSYPQLVVRLGTIAQSAVSTRRPLESVLFPRTNGPDAQAIRQV
jgi:nitroreductase